MNRETIIQMAREAGLAEVTDTNQNLRQAEQALLKRYAELVNSGDAGNWYQEAELEVIAARQALALPTAEQVDDINVAESFTSVTKTAAPVGEREAFEREMRCEEEWGHRSLKKRQNGQYENWQVDLMWDVWQARAALSAGDAGWQPIETAPKDGSDCWLLVDGDVRRGFWVEIEFEERRDMDGRYIDQADADAYWMDHDSGDSLEPTMFYPITKPLPPSLVDIDAAMRKDKT